MPHAASEAVLVLQVPGAQGKGAPAPALQKCPEGHDRPEAALSGMREERARQSQLLDSSPGAQARSFDFCSAESTAEGTC